MRKLNFPTLLLLLVMVITPALTENQFKVKRIEFEGHKAFSSDRLKQLMISSPHKFPISIFSSSDFIPDLFKDDLKNLEQFYHNQGYLQATVVDTQLNFNAKEGEVSIKVVVDEGELTRIEGISFFGNHVLNDSLLTQISGLKIADPFKRSQINDAELGLLTWYANHGYLETEVKTEIRVSDETHRAIVDFTIQENEQFTINEIRVNGLEKTKKKVVMRELLFEQGQIIEYSKLLKSQRELYLTGLFESVFIRPEDPAEGDQRTTGDSSFKDILIELKEKEYGEFNVSFGFGTIDKVRGRAEIFYTNLAGTGRKIALATRASFIRRYGEISFTEPRTVGLPWRTDVNGFLEYREDPGFDLNSIGAKVTVGRNLGRNTRTALTYRYENSDIRNVKVRPLPEGINVDIRSLILSLVYDSRDNLFDPSQGLFLELKNELAGGFLRGSDAFVRSTLEAKYFFPLSRNTIFATAMKLGWMDLFGDARDIPLNEKFYAGGPETLRAFDFQVVGPLDKKGVPIGGKFQFVLNAFELRQTIYKWFGGVAFLDLGNIWSENNQFRISDLRLSPGIGIRLSTPIGLARVDYGINVDPRVGEPAGKIYFSMGQAF